MDWVLRKAINAKRESKYIEFKELGERFPRTDPTHRYYGVYQIGEV
jgi:hypothetical protein